MADEFFSSAIFLRIKKKLCFNIFFDFYFVDFLLINSKLNEIDVKTPCQC